MPDPLVPNLFGKPTAGRATFAAWVVAPEPAVVETLMRENFDAAVLDLQHGGFDLAKAAAGIGCCALMGKPALVRVPVGEFATASRMLDAGAAGIIAPMINSVADARELAAFTKYPPQGERSWGPGRVTALSGFDGQDYLGRANGLHLTIAMIETREALDHVEAILDVDGIDGVFVGPSDLSIGLSRGEVLDPVSEEVGFALERVAEAAEAASKLAGVFTFSGAVAKAMAGRGFGLVTIATDLLLLRAAARAELAAAR